MRSSAATNLAAQVSRGKRAFGPTVNGDFDMVAPPERSSNKSGLSEQEAREFHGYFTSMTTVFVGIALVAHLLMWIWRPWFSV
jgi:light-harvesting complex 1 beta chain